MISVFSIHLLFNSIDNTNSSASHEHGRDFEVFNEKTDIRVPHRSPRNPRVYRIESK
jgi:hypothetical protein